MLHLIEKSALVAEIERRIAEHKRLELEHAKEEDFLCNHIQRCTLEKVLDFLDTLEVKEVEELNASDRELAEETIKELCEWLDDELCCYIKAQDFSIDHARLNKDLRKHLEDEIWTQRIMQPK